MALESTKDVESLYASVDGNEGTLQLIDKLTDNTENEKVMERLSLMEALEHLDAKQRQIIILRYFQDRTQADVARCIGISQVQVSRIEKRVLPNSEGIYRKRTRKRESINKSIKIENSGLFFSDKATVF